MKVYPAPRHDPEVEILIGTKGEQVYVEILLPSSLGLRAFLLRNRELLDFQGLTHMEFTSLEDRISHCIL